MTNKQTQQKFEIGMVGSGVMGRNRVLNMDTTHNSALNVWFADLPTEGCLDGAVIEFTFLWKEAKRPEGRNYSVKVSGPK